jgi:hypothetical protein
VSTLVEVRAAPRRPSANGRRLVVPSYFERPQLGEFRPELLFPDGGDLAALV